jgi:hypothetical protein
MPRPEGKDMPVPMRVLLVLVLAVTVAGCGGDDEPVALVDFCFDQEMIEVVVPAVLAESGLQAPLSGWHVPEPRGRWTLGPAAVVDCFLVGHDLKLELICSTSPALSARGQGGTVRLNGQDVAHIELPGGWAQDTTLVDLPSRLVVQGMNALALEPSIVGEEPPLVDKGIFVHRIRIRARLDASARKRLGELQNAAPRPRDTPPP